MTNSPTLTRTQLLYGFCLSLAALIGFFLADPLQSSSFAVLGVVVGILCWPLFARWHHPLLVGSLHSAFFLAFLPGNMPLWGFFAGAGFILVIFHKSINPEIRLFRMGGVHWALLALGLIVVATALAHGGVGFKALGSASTGGKKYIYLILAIMTYFVLVSRPVSSKWALTYMALYCLSGLTGLLAHLVFVGGDKFYWVFNIIDPNSAIEQAMSEWDVRGITVFRSPAIMNAAGAIVGFLVAWLGLREVFNLKRPWRLMILMACLIGGALGGFRSFLVFNAIFLAVVFFMEGLHRTRVTTGVIALSLAGFAFLVAYSERLPASLQRAISFLPVQVDPYVRQDAQASLEWRLRMWEILWPEVPGHLLLGKGYAIDPSQLDTSSFNASLGYGIQAEWAALSGEYHNGPLSVLLPFGIWGVLALGWLIVVGVLRLRWHCRNGSSELMRINRVLYAMFIAKVIFFVFFFGSFHNDLVEFTALLGLAECLNAGSTISSGHADSISTGSHTLAEERFV